MAESEGAGDKISYQEGRRKRGAQLSDLSSLQRLSARFMLESPPFFPVHCRRTQRQRGSFPCAGATKSHHQPGGTGLNPHPGGTLHDATRAATRQTSSSPSTTPTSPPSLRERRPSLNFFLSRSKQTFLSSSTNALRFISTNVPQPSKITPLPSVGWPSLWVPRRALDAESGGGTSAFTFRQRRCRPDAIVQFARLPPCEKWQSEYSTSEWCLRCHCHEWFSQVRRGEKPSE